MGYKLSFMNPYNFLIQSIDFKGFRMYLFIYERCGETPLRYVRHIVAADYIRLNVLRIASHIKRIGKITTLANFVCVS